jgi:hypothetical protein
LLPSSAIPTAGSAFIRCRSNIALALGAIACVFNPVDGVGTPFFGGYYGHADDDEEPPFPFGRSYTH